MTAEDRPRARLHVAERLDAGIVRLDVGRAHYLRHVLRLDAGDGVAVFNAHDGEFAARVVAFGRSWCDLAVGARRRAPESAGDIWLAFAPIKRTRLDYMTEKAVELGVSVLLPVFTRHTAMARINLERLNAISIEAAEQCERLSVPEIRPPQRLDDMLAGWPPARRLLVCDETGQGRPIADLLSAQKPSQPYGILIGPEGGFAAAELDGLRKLAFVSPIGLGPRVLRAETAALAALAVYQALAGDGHKSTPGRNQRST